MNRIATIFFSILSILSYSSAFSIESHKIDSLERELFSIEDPIQKMVIQIELTDLLINSNIDRAKEFATKNLDIAEERDDSKNTVRILLQLAKIYREESNMRLSMEYGNKVKTLALNLEMHKEYAESLTLLAINFSGLGSFKNSADLNFAALKIFENLNDKNGIANVYNRIGTDHFLQQNFEKALEYYLKSLQIGRETKDLAGISRGLNNLAIVYAEMNEYDLVKDYLLEAVEISKKLGRESWVAINYQNLGTIYRVQKSKDTAYHYLKLSESIFNKLDNPAKAASTNLSLALYYAEFEILDSSLYYANKTYETGVEKKLKKMIYDAASLQRDVYQRKNDFENAFKFSLIELQMKDSLNIENSTTRISQLELLYEFEKVEQEHKIKQQRREFILILSGTSIVFVLLVLIGFLIYRHRIKAKNEQIERRRLNLEIESKNKELASNVMTLIRKNEVLSTMGEQLMDIQSKAVKTETKTAIKKIAKLLQKTTDTQIWDEFEIRFRQVHSEFYEKLIGQFPDLSPNEQRLCAFLRLNMTTKEISELTGQRTDTIEIARWRLRKKLNITNTKVNLVTFLCEV